MANFFAELKRRQMYRVAAAYAVVAWLLLQLINNLTPALRLPDWAATFVLVLLIVGFPIALLFCWIQHLPADSATQSAKTGRLDSLLIGALGLVILLIAYQQIAPSSDATRQAGVDAARSSSLNPAGAISVAVLPFTNLSSDPEQEFFSDGMTEEITGALARVPDLRVVARTSAFEFKGQNRNVQTIGQQLKATHLIEGSVRRAGDRVRITAQLINAADGTHLWSQNYDRQLTDVFAIQEDIARMVTASFNMSLGLSPGENLVNNRSIDAESYEKFLRARALIQGRGQPRVAEATPLLEQVVARNPNYAPGWARLAAAYYFTVITAQARDSGSAEEFRRVVDAYIPKIEAAGRRAVQLDPTFAGGYASLAIVQWQRGNILQADELYSKASALDPSITLFAHSGLLAMLGRMREAAALKQQLQTLEPFVPVFSRWNALYLWVDGQNDAAITILNALPPETPNVRQSIGMIYASMGRYGEAADILENAPPGNGPPETLKEAARLLRAAPANPSARQSLPRLGNLDWVYLHVGAPERALENRERDVASGFPGAAALGLVWHSSWAPVRKTERFKAYVRALGLVDYWRVKGWPEFCRPMGTDDFVCD